MSSESARGIKIEKFNPMRSLVWKLILAFLGVGFAASLFVVIPIGVQTRNELI
jgi:hypothetical protein